MNNIRQFDIYVVDLSPVIGSEQSGIRPCVILQSNIIADIARTFLIAPLTSQKVEKVYPYEILVQPDTSNNLISASKIKCDQIRVIDRTRVLKKLGYLDSMYTEDLIEAVDIIFDRNGDFTSLNP